MGNIYFETIVNTINRDFPPEEEDYEKDGLLYCGKCHTARQIRKKIDWLGDKEQILPVGCECRIAQFQESRRQQQLQATEDKRKVAIPFDGYRKMTFENSDCELKDALNYIKNWEYMKKHNKGLMLYGNTGSGKTYIAASIANKLVEMGEKVYMNNISIMLGDMCDMYGGKRDECIWCIKNCNLLVIDDFGVQTLTDTSIKNVYDIIEIRTESQKPMVITTNLAPGELKATKDLRLQRVYSRTKALYAIMVEHADRRAEEFKKDYDEMEKLLRG